jgi:hypothetical protein
VVRCPVILSVTYAECVLSEPIRNWLSPVGHKARGRGRCGEYILFSDVRFVQIVSTALASCPSCGAKNFDVDSRFFGRFVHPWLR